jgi:hypothetical protein
MYLAFVFIVCFIILVSIALLRPRDSTQWQEHQSRGHIVKIDGLEDLDTISLIDVYERLIHAAIQ